MKILNATLILAAANLAAQEPPRPARVVRPAEPPTAPAPGIPAVAAAPGAPAASVLPGVAIAAPPGQWAMVGVPAIAGTGWTPPALPVPVVAPDLDWVPLPGQAPAAVARPMAIPSDELLPLYVPAQGQGQGRVLSREQAERVAEQAREMARIQAERSREMAQRQAELSREHARMQAEISREFARDDAARTRELARLQAEMTREQSRMQAELQRDQARMQADLAREQAVVGQHYNYDFNFNYNYAPTPTIAGRALPERPPSAWAQGDPADSLWRAANDIMTKGDYRKAAAMFKEIPAKFRYSQYAVDAMYWQAHALYRVGGTQDLQEALQVLESLKATYPSTRLRGNQADVGALQVRIAGVLSSRGMQGNEIVRRALSQNTNICDSEEVQIRSAALNALMQTDPASAQEYAVKALAKRDDCSRDLRRSAVFLIGNKREPGAARTLIDVAKNDPSQDVRRSAIEYLGRFPGDDALNALEELLRTSDDQETQRAAIRALANNANPRARNGIKALIERNDVNERQRISALDALNAERATTEDVAWLQQLYGKVDSPAIRSRIISAMARLGGAQNERWFIQLANNENESIEVRVQAIRQAGQAMDIAALGRLYDQTGQRSLRSEIIRQLGNRREPETIDKLGEIAKNGTDPQLRSRAIEALTQKKDERANKLILSLIDRP